jgi:hypothetical protein
MKSNLLRVHFAAALLAGFACAQTPASGPVLSLTATTDNVTGAHDSVKIDVLRWSTDAERDDLLNAWNLKTPAPAAGRGRGRAAAAAPADDPFAAGNDAPAGAAPPAAAAAGRGGGRGGGGGGRGGRGGGAAPAAPLTPETSLAVALEKAPTVGYLWSSEVAGYSLRYAAKFPAADGGQRVVLITDRRLGTNNDRWNPVVTGGPTDANQTSEFTVIEIHLNAKGEGEAKTSLTGKVVVDSAAKAFGLDNYAALQAILKGVKKK